MSAYNCSSVWRITLTNITIMSSFVSGDLKLSISQNHSLAVNFFEKKKCTRKSCAFLDTNGSILLSIFSKYDIFVDFGRALKNGKFI